jgi:ribosome-binding factor A
MRGEAHEPDLEGLSLTVTEVRPSPDLRQATVYVMPLAGREPERALDALTRARGRLRGLVGRRIETRSTPELRFVLDESFDRFDETRALLDQDRVRRDLDR